MKTIAFIPIKLNNERTPGKNIKPFSDGTPLMWFVQHNLLQLKTEGVIDEIYCFCSNEEVKKFLIDGVVFLKRPESLDSKDTKGTEIYATFVDMVDSDIYVLGHATSPFVTVDHIRSCIQNVKNGNYDSAFCAKKLQNFLWEDNRPLNFELDNPLRTQDMKPIYMELSSPYVFTRDGFKKYNSRSGINPFICEANEIEAIDIDYPEDFELADTVYMNIIKKRG